MNKEDILKKAQSKKTQMPDEMEFQIIQRSNGISVFCILVFVFVLMIVKMIAGQPWYDVYSIMFASMAAQHLYKGFKLHQKHEIAFGIIFGLLAVVMLAAALFAILGTGK